MKILSKLSAAESIEATWTEPRGGVISAVFDESEPGVIRRITLMGGGIIINRGDVRVAIPLEDLLTLAEKCEPALRASKPSEKLKRIQ